MADHYQYYHDGRRSIPADRNGLNAFDNDDNENDDDDDSTLQQHRGQRWLRRRRRRAHHRSRAAVAGTADSFLLPGPTAPPSVVVHLLLLFLLFGAAFVSGKPVVDAETGGECIDADPVNCPFWAATGECQANKGYMHVHCKKSCDRCK